MGYEKVLGEFSSWDEVAEPVAEAYGDGILRLEVQKAAYSALRIRSEFGAQHRLTKAVKKCYLDTWGKLGCDPCRTDPVVDDKQECLDYMDGEQDLTGTNRGGIEFFTACVNNKRMWKEDRQRILD